MERLISEYHHHRRHHGRWGIEFHKLIHEKQLALVDYYRLPLVRTERANLQTRFIAGVMSVPAEHMPPDDELIEIALKHLDLFDFIGLTERFPESLLLFADTFGCRPQPDVLRKNVSPSRSADLLSQDDLEVLLELSQLDLELYRRAMELYSERSSRMFPPSPAKER